MNDSIIRTPALIALRGDRIAGPAGSDVRADGGAAPVSPAPDPPTDVILRFDEPGRMILPGFVDPHTHFFFGGDRAREFGLRLSGKSYQEIAAAGGGIRSTVKATRAASDEDLAASLIRHLDRALLDGTTTVEVKVSYGLDIDEDLRGLRIVDQVARRHPVRIVPSWMGAHEFPDEYRNDHEGWVTRLCEGAREIAAQGIARFCDVFCEEGLFTPDQSRRILEAAAAAGLKLKIHADEFGASGGSEVAIALQVTSADHLHCLPVENIPRLLAAGVVPVALPGTSFFLRLPSQAPVRQMIDQGLPVAIATDGNPGSNMTESMPMMMTLACLQYGITPTEAFEAATINAARAIGMEHDVGRLDAGYFADFQVVEVPSLDHLAYHYGRSHVRAVYIGGKKVVDDGRVIR
ncbi:MAG: imidazolonepropionase [Candidatus Eisenbacteria bacterium]|nr:imidazolonepropionase [Candidatus Eisenbacteria bacterium]